MTQAGDTVSGYQLIRPLGEGPFGVVWQARDVNGTPLVVKLLHVSFIQRPSGQAAFSRLMAAVRAHEALPHEGLARVFGAVHDPSHSACGMACEFIDGRLVSEIRMPPAGEQDAKSLAVVLAWFEELGEILAWLHAQGIVHGNLKPTNVKLVRETYGHRIKLLDLSWSAIGLAAPADGTMSFLAPEQLRGAPPSAYSDQWSLAKMLAEVLAGSGRGGLGQLPASLAVTIQRANHPEPAFRFPQIMEFVGALRHVRSELSRPVVAGYAPYGPFGGPTASAGHGQNPLASNTPFSPEASIPGVPFAPVNPAAPPASSQAAGEFGDPVFVPTARVLETTAAGALPQTGEHEAVNLKIPMPVVSTPFSADQSAPPMGAPTLSADEAQAFDANRGAAIFGMPTAPRMNAPKSGRPPVEGMAQSGLHPTGDSPAAEPAFNPSSLQSPPLKVPEGPTVAVDPLPQTNGATAPTGHPPRTDTKLLDRSNEPPAKPPKRGWLVLLAASLLVAAGAAAVVRYTQNPQPIQAKAVPPEPSMDPPSSTETTTGAVAESEDGGLTDAAVASAAARAPTADRPAPGTTNQKNKPRVRAGSRKSPQKARSAPSPAKVAAKVRPPSKGAASSNGPQGPTQPIAKATPDAGVPAQTALAAPEPISEEVEEAQVGCDEGDGESCMEVADHFREIGDIKAALSAAKRACDFNYRDGCVRAGRAYSTRRPEVAFALFEKGCDLKSASACHQAAELLGRTARIRDPDKAAAFAGRACALGRTASCSKTRTSTSP